MRVLEVEVFTNSDVAYVTKVVRVEMPVAEALRLIADNGIDESINVCANTKCGKTFTRQWGRAEKGQFRKEGLKYCSRLCARSQAARNLRKRRSS
jgi:hypothetical protein